MSDEPANAHAAAREHAAPDEQPPGNASEAATAAEWIALLARELGVNGMTPRAQAALLSMARDVAHGTERKYAPLASFIAGRFVELAARDGRDIEAALRDVRDAVTRLVRETPTTP